MRRSFLFHKATILGGLGIIPLVLCLVFGFERVFLAPLLLMGSPLMGLSVVLYGIWIYSGFGIARQKGKQNDQLHSSTYSGRMASGIG